MDPKQNSNQPLDPKLQAVYDKVMGANPAAPQIPATPAEPTPATPVIEPTTPPAAPEPVMPPMPTPPVAPEPPSPVMPENPPVTPAPEPTPTPPMPTPEPTPPASPEPTPDPLPANAPDDTMNATIAMPAIQPHVTETIKIGTGGSPVAHEKTKKKGISPIILIFGAFAFLVVYAVFWVRFFGLTLPFLSK